MRKIKDVDSRAGKVFMRSLRTLRQRWVTSIACGPELYVDLQVAQELKNPFELEIGPPIHDLDEGLDDLDEDLEDLDEDLADDYQNDSAKASASHADQHDGNGAAGPHKAISEQSTVGAGQQVSNC